MRGVEEVCKVVIDACSSTIGNIETDQIATMSAKSLGTLAMIYATDELQNPLPLKTMLCEGDMNNPVGKSDAFLYN